MLGISKKSEVAINMFILLSEPENGGYSDILIALRNLRLSAYIGEELAAEIG